MEIKIEMQQIGNTSTKATIRDHEIMVDRPEAKGGSNKGPMGGEILLAALGGCFSSNLLEIINTREVAISEIRLNITGILAGTPVVFKKITVEVAANHDDKEQLEKFVTMADRACISSNTLKSSEVDVIYQVI